MPRFSTCPLLFALALLAACGDKDQDGADTGPTDGGAADGGATDGGTTDGGTTGSGTTGSGTTGSGTTDGGTTDGGTPTAWTRPVRAIIDAGAHDVVEEYSRPTEGTVATRLVAIYTPYDGEGETVEVRWEVDEDVYLVLHNYNATAWVVTESHAGRVRGILSSCDGRGASVDAPSGATLSCGPEGYAGDAETWLSLETRILEQWLDSEGYPPLASTHYEYDNRAFTLQEADDYTDDPTLPDCADPEAPVPFEPPDTSWVAGTCPDLAADTWVCATIAGYDIVLVGIDSGESCVVRDNPLSTSTSTTGGNIAWLGSALYALGTDGSVTEVPFLTDTHRYSHTYSNGVAGDSDGLVVRFDGSHGAGYLWEADHLYRYGSFAELQCETGTPHQPLPSTTSNDAFTVSDDFFVDAWHSTDQVVLYDRTTGDWLEDLYLGGRDTYVYGMDIVEDELLVLWRGSPQELVRHDLATGAPGRAITLPDPVRGVSCAQMP